MTLLLLYTDRPDLSTARGKVYKKTLTLSAGYDTIITTNLRPQRAADAALAAGRLFMYKTKIELVGLSDVNKFVAITSKLPGKIKLTDGENYSVNAKSLLGALASMEWDSLYCESDVDIYTHISEFAK